MYILNSISTVNCILHVYIYTWHSTQCTPGTHCCVNSLKNNPTQSKWSVLFFWKSCLNRNSTNAYKCSKRRLPTQSHVGNTLREIEIIAIIPVRMYPQIITFSYASFHHLYSIFSNKELVRLTRVQAWQNYTTCHIMFIYIYMYTYIYIYMYIYAYGAYGLWSRQNANMSPLKRDR